MTMDLQSLWTWVTGGTMSDFMATNLGIALQIIMIVVSAYIIGRLVKRGVAHLLDIIGLKKVTEKSWAEGVLRITGYKGTFAELIADLAKWMIYIVFFTLFLEVIGLSGITYTSIQIASFVPRFIASMLLIVLGFIIADFFGKVFEEAGAKTMGDDKFGKFTGGIARYSIGMVVLVMSLSLLGLDIAALAILLSAFLVMIIIIATLGIKDILPEVTSGIQLRESIRVGDKIKVGPYAGTVEKMEPLGIKLDTGRSFAIIPNTMLTKTVIEKLKRK